MTPEEIQAELEPAAELLRTGTLARLAYDGIDGTPRAIPIAFHWTGTEIVLATHPSAPKYRALLARPRVALTIDIASPARALLLRGTAEIEVVDGVVPEYLEAARKSMEGDELEGFEAAVRATYDRMARIAIRPDWARYFDFDAGRMPDFLRALTS